MRKYTYQEVKEIFEGKGFELVSKEYINCKQKLQFICPKHKNMGVQEITFDVVKNKADSHICRYCAKEFIALSNRVDEELIKSLCEKLNFQFVGTHIENQSTYVLYICNNHQDKGIQKKKWTSFNKSVLNNKGCPYCSHMKRTSEDFYNDVAVLHPTMYIKEGQYLNRSSRIDCRCKICNHKWETSAESLLMGHGCFECHKKKMSLSRRKHHSDYVTQLNQINPNIELITEYVDSRNKIKCRCKKCDNVWETAPYSLLNLKYGCPKCGIKYSNQSKRITQEEFVERLHSVLPHIDVVEKYIKPDIKIKFKCNVHNEEYYQLPYEALAGKRGCHKCIHKSYGEQRICNFLEENNIIYSCQHKFNDCNNIRPLPFDFYLPDCNTCIEYDGELHYKSIDYFGGITALNQTKYRDDIKTEYCLKNNVQLIRIPYWEFDNIEKILCSKLNLTNKKLGD